MIEINNLTTNQIDEEFLKSVCQRVLKEEKLKNRPGRSAAYSDRGRPNDASGQSDADLTELSIALIGQGKMRKLNKRYRNKNKITDVLVFPELKISVGKFGIGSFQKTSGMGEIVLCVREIKKNAKKFNSFFEKELNRCLIHGILHLLGYDHEKSEAEAEKMKKKEEYYLDKCKV